MKKNRLEQIIYLVLMVGYVAGFSTPWLAVCYFRGDAFFTTNTMGHE